MAESLVSLLCPPIRQQPPSIPYQMGAMKPQFQWWVGKNAPDTKCFSKHDGKEAVTDTARLAMSDFLFIFCDGPPSSLQQRLFSSPFNA